MPTGACLCGNLKYEYSGEPTMKAICHCIECRKIGGGTGTYTYLLPAPSFSVTSGTPTTHSKQHESGMTLTRHFCPTCSSAIYKESDVEWLKGMVIVFAGTLDELELPVPDTEFWVKYRLPWVDAVKGASQKMEFA